MLRTQSNHVALYWRRGLQMQRRSSGSSMSGGMQGYTCSTSRDTCSPCEQPWMYIVTLLGSALSSAIGFHVLTIMAVDAGVDTRSLHSAIMRVWQSWTIAHGVLGQFDLNDILALA